MNVDGAREGGQFITSLGWVHIQMRKRSSKKKIFKTKNDFALRRQLAQNENDPLFAFEPLPIPQLQ